MESLSPSQVGDDFFFLGKAGFGLAERFQSTHVPCPQGAVGLRVTRNGLLLNGDDLEVNEQTVIAMLGVLLSY